MKNLNTAILGILGVVGLVLISAAYTTPAFAQDTGAPASAPAGIGVLIFLLGIAAIGFVGFSYLAQSRASREDEKDIEDAEEE